MYDNRQATSDTGGPAGSCIGATAVHKSSSVDSTGSMAESTTVQQHDSVSRNGQTADVRDVPLSVSVSSFCCNELDDFSGSCRCRPGSSTANTKSREQQNKSPSHKKNCNRDSTDGNGSRQKVTQKPDEKWTVVGKDSKHDNRSTEPPKVSTQTKGRKKTNRRNRDRTASSATLDFRSTSCSSVRADSDLPKNPGVSETKSFHSAEKVTSKEKAVPSSGVGKQSSHHGKSDRLPPSDVLSCRSSAGDDGRDTATRTVARDDRKPVSTASFCSDLCEIALDDCTVSRSVTSSSILDASKIDALDSFDDLLPLSVSSARRDLEQSAAETGEQWTAVNRRCKKDQIASAARLVAAVSLSAESEQTKKRLMSTMQLCNVQVPGRSKNAAATTGRSVQADSGLRAKVETTAGVLPTETFDSCYPALPSAQESSTTSVEADSCCGKLETMPNVGPVGSNRAPSGVKEYSLFDNHFSAAVENVLKNDICVSSARGAFSGGSSMGLSTTVDEALLAKAPGYRASTSSPCGGRYLVDRPRKYSNDSSSSLSSVRSTEDTSPSNVPPVGGGGVCILPAPPRPRPSHIPDIARSSVLHSVADVLSHVPPVCAPTPFADFRPTSGELNVTTTSAGLSVAGHSEHYSSPNHPMTLPRISTDLNPNAPDFVFRPTTQVSSQETVQSSTSHSDVPVFAASKAGAGGSFYIPGELSSSESGSARGRWSEPAMARSEGGIGLTDGGSMLFDISLPVLALDMSPRHWTMHNNLLQESLTFG